MENALLSLLGVLIYGSGAAVLGVSLIQLVDNIQLVDKRYTHPLILLGLVFNVIAGFITAVVGFIYAWEHMHRL